LGTHRKFRVGLTDKMVLIAFGLAAVYWILDTLLSIFMSYDLNISSHFFGTGAAEIWPRLIVICLFVIFGSHSQFTINERKKAEEKSKQETATRERFQRLLSPDLAEMVVSGALTVEKGGTNRVATVMFVDIRGFTSMSENVQAAEVLQMLNEYYEKIVDIVFAHEGTVDKFIGDGIMVIWGAPVSHDDDPARAVRAAVDIRRELISINRQRVSEGKEEIKIGIGINTGKVVAGYIGSSQTMSYSVVGDTVNTASRLCSAAKPGEIIISEVTHAKTKGLFPVKELEPLQAKGKFNPLKVYDVQD
jgi:adenylate cyclase